MVRDETRLPLRNLVHSRAQLLKKQISYTDDHGPNRELSGWA
ncbi:MAG TPA: hypothetical protein VM580_24300 [Labilithrix sp.]|jgi:hypothetical protein|nr:hypothetical protein [Labilithrix sp.]